MTPKISRIIALQERAEKEDGHLQRKDSQALIDRILELEGEIKEFIPLFQTILSSRKGSMGSFNNVYLPQLQRDAVEILYDKLQKLLEEK